jgi:hypothetical protein
MFQSATRAVLQDEIDVIIIGLSMMNFNKKGLIFAQFIQPEQNLLLNEGLV